MKKALLILLVMLLPWQAIAAAERNLVHVMSSGSAHGLEFVAKHMAEHDAHVLHHHDDDENDDGVNSSSHEDNSQKSAQHLADYEHGCTLHILIPACNKLPLAETPSTPPRFAIDTLSNRTTIPLLRPPRTPA